MYVYMEGAICLCVSVGGHVYVYMEGAICLCVSVGGHMYVEGVCL